MASTKIKAENDAHKTGGEGELMMEAENDAHKTGGEGELMMEAENDAHKTEWEGELMMEAENGAHKTVGEGELMMEAENGAHKTVGEGELMMEAENDAHKTGGEGELMMEAENDVHKTGGEDELMKLDIYCEVGMHRMSQSSFEFPEKEIKDPDINNFTFGRFEKFTSSELPEKEIKEPDINNFTFGRIGKFTSSELPEKEIKDSDINKFTFGWFEMFTGVASIIIFFFDVGTDINLAITYFKMHQWLWAAVTTGIVVVPSIVICCLGLQWYIIDYHKEKKHRQASRCVWFLRIFFTLLQCGPVIRTIEYLQSGYKSLTLKLQPDKEEACKKYILRQNLDICLLALFGSFFEAVPQLVIQIYIMITLKPSNNFLYTSEIVFSLLTSWCFLAISLASYNKILRMNLKEKAKMLRISFSFYFVWRASEVGGRILCIAMFASVFKYWIFLVLVLHWLIMFIWLIEQKTTFYRNRSLEIAFNLLCSYVMIFCFLNLREGHTRFRYLIFFCVLYAENFIMLALWFRFTHDLGAWFHLWGFAAVIVLFVVHIVFQIIYYVIFHPTKKIKMCLPCNRFLVYSSMCSDVSSDPRNKSKILYNSRQREEVSVSLATSTTAV